MQMDDVGLLCMPSSLVEIDTAKTPSKFTFASMKRKRMILTTQLSIRCVRMQMRCLRLGTLLADCRNLPNLKRFAYTDENNFLLAEESEEELEEFLASERGLSFPSFFV